MTNRQLAKTGRPKIPNGLRAKQRQPPPKAPAGLVTFLEQIIATTTLLVGLAYHIGRSQTRAWAGYYGLDVSFLKLNTQEYVQRSLDTFFFVILILVIVSAIAISTSQRFETILDRQKNLRLLRAMMGLLLISSGLALAIGFVATVIWIDDFRPALATAAGIGVTLLAYRHRLRVKYAKALGIQLEGRASPAYPYLMATVAILSLFWLSSEFSTMLGLSRAEYVASNLKIRPHVRVYSDESLTINQPGVVETEINLPDSAYRFQYEGMRLLTKADDTFFLIPDQWTKSKGSIVILHEQQNLRFEIYDSSEEA